MTTVTVTDVTRGDILAQGEDALLIEGGYYFDPEQVKQDHLVVSTRPYTCPYKGLMYWIDLQTPTGTIRDVAWVYTEPHAKYEHIRDKIAFAFGMRPGVMVEKT
ncbi:MAG: DUF427 domain-containing protein [Anaerolineae bacterium]|nr:DUF427 domain-containing protein [Anaerolineae bacterium]